MQLPFTGFEDDRRGALTGRLVRSVHDSGDLLAKESRAAGSGMTNTMGFDVQFLQLRGSDVAKPDDFLAWKEIEASVEDR